MENSKIQWTDHTFNPWIGCSFARTLTGDEIIQECIRCYAKEMMDTRLGKAKWGKRQSRVRTSEANWKLPLKWNQRAICGACGYAELLGSDDCRNCGKPFSFTLGRRNQRVFCASLSDWLDEEAPIEWLADLLKVIRETQNLDWMLLTKRPQNWHDRINAAIEWLRVMENSEHGTCDESPAAMWLEGWKLGLKIPGNVWIGVSAGADLYEALDIPAHIHFLSCEPMLKRFESSAKFDWAICGGESGKSARECREEWIREFVYCQRLMGTPVFVKQMGACSTYKGVRQTRYTDSHAGNIDEFPADLRVREFPE